MKCRTLMKVYILAATLVCLMSNATFANTAEEVNRCIDVFPYVDLRIDAVATDMDLYIGWLFDEKKQMAESAEKAVAELNDIEHYLVALTLPEWLYDLRNRQVEIIDRYKKIYSGIENKDPQQIADEFSSIENLNNEYTEKLKEIVKETEYLEPLVEKDIKVINEETALIQNAQDKQAYLKAVGLIEEGKYKKAHEILKKRRIERKRKASDYPLSGILYCAKCNHKYLGISSISNHRTGEKKRWYRCSGPQRSFIKCKNKSVKAEEIEPKVAALLDCLLRSETLKTSR